MELIGSKKKSRIIEILMGDHSTRQHEAIVSTETLIQLNILNHTWLYATHHQDSEAQSRYTGAEKHNPNMMLCFVDAGDNILCEKGVAMISLEAAFNIIFPDLDTFNMFQDGKKIKICLHLTENIFYEPPVANEIKISVIRSPLLYKISDEYDKSLKSHFSKRRYLVLNQIFCIPYKDKSKTNNNSAKLPYLWFRVTYLQDKKGLVASAWITAENTMMSQCGSESAFVPYKEICNVHQKFMVGLQEQFETVINLCMPAMVNMTDCSNITLLLHGPPASGKRCLATLVSNYLCLHFYDINCFDFIGGSLTAVKQHIKNLCDKAKYLSPCLFLLRNIHAFCKGQNDDGDEPRLIRYLSEGIRELSSQDKVILMATTNCFNQINSTVSRLFPYQIEIGPPKKEVRSRLLKVLLQDEEQMECNLEVINKKTAGMVLGDFPTLISEAINSAISRLCYSGENEQRTSINQHDIDSALENFHAKYKEMLGMPDIPQVSWNDVGGLVSVKAEIIDTIKLPMQYPELISKGLRRSGLLLYGPPGCGKTLLAKAVATEFSLYFFSVKGPELMNMYVGQSEQNVRDMFQKARESSPCIIFFDELDSIAPNRGRSGDSGGVMDRIVSQLLAELDGLQTSNDLFVIGATNRPDLIDNCLLRPGRFDKMVYVGFPETKADRLSVIKSYTNKMQLSADIDLDKLESSLPLHLTGADFYALCSDAYLSAMKRCIKDNVFSVNRDGMNNQKGIQIRMCDFDTAAKELIPSVSLGDVLRYKEIRSQIDGERIARK